MYLWFYGHLLRFIDESWTNLLCSGFQLQELKPDIFWQSSGAVWKLSSHTGHPVPNTVIVLMVSGGAKQHWTWTATSELRNCVKVKVAILGSLSIVQIVVIVLMVSLIVQELCESRGGCPGLSVLTSLLVSVGYNEPCFGIGLSLSLICQLTSEDIKQHYLPCGLCGQKATSNLNKF